MLGAALLLGLEAEPAPVNLRWTGTCDDTAVVFERLEQELKGTADSERWVEVDATIEAVSTDSGATAVVSLRTETGETERRLDAESCEELHLSVALLLAIHVDPFGDEPAPEPEPEPEPEQVPETTSEPILEAAPLPSTSRPAVRRPPEVLPEPGLAFLRVGFGVSAGVLPRVAPAFELAGGWTRGHLRIDGRGTYLPPQDDSIPGGTLTYQSWDIAGRGCGLLFGGAITVPLCGAVGVGAVHGAASGFERDGRDARALVYAAASVGLDWAMASRVWFWARAEGGASVLRPRFEIDGVGTVYTVRSWRAGGSIGVRFDFL